MEHLPDFILNHLVLVSLLVLLIISWLGIDRASKGASVSPFELSQSVNQDTAVVLDIRSASDFHKGHIAQSINIPFGELKDRLHQLDKYAGKSMIIVCQSGVTAIPATQLLKQSGYRQVSKLEGGINRWRQDNLPLIQ